MLEIHAFKCPHGLSAGGNEKTFHFLFPREKRIMGDCDFIFFLLYFFLLYKFFITNMYCFFLVLLFNIYFFQTLNFYSVLGSIANYQCCGSFRWTVKNICCFCNKMITYCHFLSVAWPNSLMQNNCSYPLSIKKIVLAYLFKCLLCASWYKDDQEKYLSFRNSQCTGRIKFK